MPEKFTRPFGVYDTNQCGLVYIGLYDDEADTWRAFLGWPDDEEIEAAKKRGLCVLSLTCRYEPPECEEPMSDYLNTVWRSVPSVAALMPVEARKARIDYTVIVDMGAERNPILIANNLPADVADHIVELHNKSI